MFRCKLLSLLLFLCVNVSADYTNPEKLIEIESRILNEKRSIQVYVPESYSMNDKTYPVLYLTDSEFNFSHTASTTRFLSDRHRIPEMIVIGILNTDSGRNRDLTPNATKAARDNQGGADDFLRFLSEELIPYVEKNFRTAPYRVYSGHSFGGLFAVYSLLYQPDLFDAYIAISTSLWWDNERLVKESADFFKKNANLNKSFFIASTSQEEEGDNGFNAYLNFVDVMKTQSSESFSWDSREFRNESHISVPLLGQYHGLLHVWREWLPSPKTIAGGAKLIEQHYKKISKRFGYRLEPDEEYITNLALSIHWNGNTESAVDILEYYLGLQPNSEYAYDALGVIKEESGELNVSIRYYQKALELLKTDDTSGTSKSYYESAISRVRVLLDKQQNR